MLVRFDSRALQQNLEHEKPPIGVEGDPVPDDKKGGVSEADALVREAGKNAGVVREQGEAGSLKEEAEKEIEAEQKDKEEGPEVSSEALKQATRP